MTNLRCTRHVIGATGCEQLKGDIMADTSTSKSAIGKAVDVILPLLLLAILIALCVQLLFPFVGLLIWTIIFAVCFYPLHAKLRKKVSNRMSAIIIGLGLSALVLVPTTIAAMSAAGSIPQVLQTIQTGEKAVPPPPARLKELPIVGKRADDLWTQASTDMPAFAKKYRPQLASFTKTLLGFAGSLFVTVLAVVAAVIFAAITLAYSESARAFIANVLARITGSRKEGEHYMDIIGATIKSVANGVIGVAFVQALLVGIGFFAVGVPGAGLLSIVAMALGVVQVPVLLVTLPAIAWAFSAETTTVAIIFTIWSVIAGLSDAVLKPLMIGHGLEVPMPIILLGVIGGVMAFGLVGLFIGAVVLAVGYVLFIEWVGNTAPETDTPKLPKAGTLQAAE
jgi:predicted PurR-regulated permease PerM